MFSFYGSKSKIIKYYPKPLHNKINEVFAGSARYSLQYFENDVTICDIDSNIISIWKYLQNASKKDILSLPNIPNATRLESVDGFSILCQEEKWLIGFCSNGGSASPKNISGRHNFNSWNKDKIRISENLYKIKHWNILLKNYKDIQNENSTWFIDPPYVDKGKWYKEHDIDYKHLSNWCKSRVGQVIVCEAGNADWLPFNHLKEISFTHFKNDEDKKRKTNELIWYQEDNGIS